MILLLSLKTKRKKQRKSRESVMIGLWVPKSKNNQMMMIKKLMNLKRSNNQKISVS